MTVESRSKGTLRRWTLYYHIWYTRRAYDLVVADSHLEAQLETHDVLHPLLVHVLRRKRRQRIVERRRLSSFAAGRGEGIFDGKKLFCVLLQYTQIS